MPVGLARSALLSAQKNWCNIVQEEDYVAPARGGHRKPIRRGGDGAAAAADDRKALPIGKKMSTTNAHEDYALRPVSLMATAVVNAGQE